MKKLWTVSIETETMVAAETREEAERIARDERRNLSQWSCFASIAKCLAPEWDPDCIPYGGEGSYKTVGQYLKESAPLLAGTAPKDQP